MKAWYLAYLILLLPSLSNAQMPSLFVKTSCMDLMPVQAEELKSLKEEIKSSPADIHKAFNRMKNYYQKNNLPLDCVFTIACKGCDGTDYLRYPIKSIKHGMPSNEILATKGGKYGRSNLEKLYSNKLIYLNSASTTVDLSRLEGLKRGRSYDLYIEHTVKDSTDAAQLKVDDSLHVKLSDIISTYVRDTSSIETIKNKIYYLHNGRKRYISPKSFSIYPLSREEKERLKDATMDYKKIYPEKNDKQVIAAMVEMLETVYGTVLYSDMEAWYYSIFKY